MSQAENIIVVNGREVAFTDERNLLEVIRKAGIEIPTFCYHSELSIYGACRLCLVEVQGKGIMAACSTAPEKGMVIQTETQALRQMRKINIELLLASHDRECPTCSRSSSCSLQNIARRLGIETVRYKQSLKNLPKDDSSPSLVRDPNKCILCGDCVRVCAEVQSIGAIDFAFRGSNARVVPAFDKKLDQVECVNCGQCAVVCPTGAIVPKSQRQQVWEAIYNPKKKVVVQVAPAVRAALGEMFNIPKGENVAGKLVNALRLMGFDAVYDTCFTADMTIFEEATELLDRIGNGGKMPMFTSCCPGWVKFAEIYYPELLGNISSTRSPQQIFGAVARETLPAQLSVDPEDMVVVSIMPCTAKKYEAQLPKFARNGRPDVDYVLTTIEVAQMIGSVGIHFAELESEAFDMPYGFATGGGVIFGATGGVMEAALRYAGEKLQGKPLDSFEFKAVRGIEARKEAELAIGGAKVRAAVVHGLGNARKLIEEIKAGEADYDFIEVMACPGGCVCGGGQPAPDGDRDRKTRAEVLYASDRTNQLHNPQDNYLVAKCYEESFGGCPGSHKAHEQLHTGYQDRSQVFDAKVLIQKGASANPVEVCMSLCPRGDGKDRELIDKVAAWVESAGKADDVALYAAMTVRPEAENLLSATVAGEACGGSDGVDAIFERIKKALK